MNLLMLWVFVVWLGFFISLSVGKSWGQFLGFLKQQVKTFQLVLVAGFFIAGVVALFFGGLSQDKLGQFVVLFLQPISVFIITKYSFQNQETKEKFLNPLLVTCYLLLAVTGLYALVQYFTLLGVPPEWWGNTAEPKRALAFFLHPNFFALFITPLLAFALPHVTRFIFSNSDVETLNKLETQNSNSQNTVIGQMFQPLAEKVKGWLPAVAWLLGAVGLLLSMSRGGWLGLAAACGVYVLILRNKKIFLFALVTVMVMAMVMLVVPNFRYRLTLPFKGEKSAVSRMSLAQTGLKMVGDSPVFGKGLLGYSNNFERYNTDPGLTHHPTPHNLYLALWVDTGLLGLLSFLGLSILALWRGIRPGRTVAQLGVALAVVAILTHGLVDTPYMKNDLAILFWIIMSFI